MRRPSRLPALVLLVLALVGCRESEGERARRTVESFIAALVRGDGSAACAHLGEAGVSELLLTALQADLDPIGLDAATVDRCALITRELAAEAPELSRLRDVGVNRTLLEGDLATVETDAGAYELEESQGEWRLTSFAPVAAILSGRPAPLRPVSLAIARPELSEPALGPSVAGSTRDASLELTGTVAPANARVEVQSTSGTRVRSVDVRDGRFRLELELRRGSNEVVLAASAPGHADTALAVRLTRK